MADGRWDPAESLRRIERQVEAEVAEIMSRPLPSPPPVVPVPIDLRYHRFVGMGTGNGRPSLAPQFENLDTGQRSRIRREVAVHNTKAEITRQARKYGVSRATILKVIGRQ